MMKMGNGVQGLTMEGRQGVCGSGDRDANGRVARSDSVVGRVC